MTGRDAEAAFAEMWPDIRDAHSASDAYKIWNERISRAEKDPHGKSPNEKGSKLDQGKNRLGLVFTGFARALTEVGRVGTFGANKYTDDGWLDVPDGQRRYTDALYRHMLKEACGEEVDVDSGLLHASHSAWNALSRLELKLREREGIGEGA